MIAKVIVATIPAVLIGLFFDDQIEQLNGIIWVVIVMLVLVGIPMILFGKASETADNREIEKSVYWKTAIKIGLVQALALIPGSSRSGVTILAGLNSNLSAEKATEFSFLMAIPIILGASVKTLMSDGGVSFIRDNLSIVIFGNIASFVAGMFAIGFLMRFISNRGLRDFGWYRLCLAAVLTTFVIFGVL